MSHRAKWIFFNATNKCYLGTTLLTNEIVASYCSFSFDSFSVSFLNTSTALASDIVQLCSWYPFYSFAGAKTLGKIFQWN